MKKKSVLFIIMGLLFSCNEKDFEVPQSKTTIIPQGRVLTISAVKANLDRFNPEKTITFIDKNQFMDGYVVSSDRNGNFFKELVLQNHPDHPTSGIQVLINERALYQRYPLGTKVRIRLQGLSVGFENGISKLGKLVGNQIQAIDFSSIDSTIFRTNEIEKISPLPISINTITKNHESLYLTFTNFQFIEPVIFPMSKTLAGEKTDSFDGFRPMIDCNTNATLVLCTSTFASFKSIELPSGSGTVSGILSRDFGDDFFVLKMNRASDLQFVSENRCDPIFFNCKNNDNPIANQILFEEDFETITNENKLEPLGWINRNVTGDEKRWTDKKISNVANRVLSISAFNTNLRPLEAWLITPEIIKNEETLLQLQFRVRTLFNNGNALKVWVTNNYSGNPLTTQWELLPVDIPLHSTNYKTITQNLSCLSGSIRVAFQYKGFDPVLTSTYNLDDIRFFSSAVPVN